MLYVICSLFLVKPIRVKIATPNDLLTAGHPVPIRCESWGSYPAAKITWLLDGEPIRNAEVTVHSDKEVSKDMTSTTSPTAKLPRNCLTILRRLRKGETFYFVSFVASSQDNATLCRKICLQRLTFDSWPQCSRHLCSHTYNVVSRLIAPQWSQLRRPDRWVTLKDTKQGKLLQHPQNREERPGRGRTRQTSWLWRTPPLAALMNCIGEKFFQAAQICTPWPSIDFG